MIVILRQTSIDSTINSQVTVMIQSGVGINLFGIIWLCYAEQTGHIAKCVMVEKSSQAPRHDPRPYIRVH